jgi:hypothetical protein
MPDDALGDALPVARQDTPSYKNYMIEWQEFAPEKWEMVGTDIGKFVTNTVGAVAGEDDITSIIDQISSFGASETSASNKLCFAKFMVPLYRGDFPSLVAIKIEEEQTSKGAGFKNSFLRKKSATAQIIYIQPGNDAADQELKRLGFNFADIERFTKVKFKGEGILFDHLSNDEREKLRDEDVITTIDDHFEAADEITDISLTGCVGITDATLVHIYIKCTQLEVLSVDGCVQITDDGIQAIVEKIGNKLTRLDYSDCNRCSNAALQAVVHHCPNLESLSAMNTGIKQIPDSIGTDFPKLKQLFLRNNNIKRLPPSIALLSDTLRRFNIDGNPLEYPPLEIVD